MENKIATIEDLLKELWLRKRNSGGIVWKTKNGEEIPIKDVSDSHLINAINCVIRNQEISEIAAEYSAYIEDLYN